MKKQSLLVVSASALSLVALAALANKTFSVSAYGAKEALTDSEYTLEEMLTYALQDEYLALAEYDVIIDTFGAIRPFTNIVKAEQTHVDLLLPLFETYSIDLIPDTSTDLVIVPASITEALAAGVTAEINNIAMYDAFLSQELPEDVATVFDYLKTASENHLAAFSKVRGPMVSQLPKDEVEDPIIPDTTEDDDTEDDVAPVDTTTTTCIPVGIGQKGPKSNWRNQ